MIGVISKGMATVPLLQEHLGEEVLFAEGFAKGSISAVAGWGARPSARKARLLSESLGVPFWSVEEGFLCSLGVRKQDEHSMSLLLDKTGVHYDARRTSDLEQLLLSVTLTAPQQLRAEQAAARLVATRMSKYGPGELRCYPEKRTRRILLVDQVAGDMSIEAGLASADTFAAMAEAAKAQVQTCGAEVWVKAHPAVLAGRKGSLRRAWLPDAHWVPPGADVFQLLEEVDEVWVVTSQLGMDALLARKPVRCFGMPFYAGWGLTVDEVKCSRRGRNLSLEELFFATYLQYARYVSPVSGRRCSFEEALDHLCLQLEHWVGDSRVFFVGFQPWKHDIVRLFMGDRDRRGQFVDTVSAARNLGMARGDLAVVWGHRTDIGQLEEARALGAQVVRVEDGFLRSVGLGSDLIAPLSLVFDRAGIYYDCRTKSGLEQLLETCTLSSKQAARTAKLIETICSLKVTKYNYHLASTDVKRKLEALRERAAGRRLLLIPGQVRADASLVFGCGAVQDFRHLAQEIRKLEPNAFLVFRPHPDVLRGNRQGDIREISDLVDHVECDLDTLSIADIADEVHCLTSLTGFEALMRGRTVHTWGMPFYAGWGLTVDHGLTRARARQLTLLELVWGTLVKYPRYFDWRSRCFMTPEQALRKLADGDGIRSLRQSGWKNQLHRASRAVAGWWRSFS